MSRHLILFAASRDQKRYFDQMVNFVKLPDRDILTVKSSKVPFSAQAFLKIFTFLPSEFAGELRHQVDILKKRKQASRKGRHKPSWFWWLFIKAESFRAKYLFIRYSLWLESKTDICLGIWNGKKFRQAILVIAAKQQKVPLIFFETGPLPGYSVADPEGVDFFAATPRNLSFYQRYRCRLNSEERLSLESVEKPKNLPASYIFIPFQVVEDSNIYLHSPWIKDMRDLYSQVEALAEYFPAQQFVIKPHPACPEDYSDLIDRSHPQIHFLMNEPTTGLVQHADAVITVNSTVGMEALIAHKKVIVMGQAIYGFSGLTKPVNDLPSLMEAIKRLPDWHLDKEAIDNYLCYLQADYAIPGDAMKNPNEEHWTVLSDKLRLFLDGRGHKAIGL